MPILPIIEFPSPKLKLVAKRVDSFNDELKQIYADMLDTMYAEDGVGLAATQVDIQLQIFIADVSENKQTPICFINPQIIQQHGEIIWEEGCLSFPGVRANVKRFKEVTVAFQDLQGATQQLTANDLLAVCIQHEMDHLNGITFFDHLSPLKQQMLRKKLSKQRDNVSWT